MHANKDLAGQIMFEFNQDAVLQAGVEGESNLASLSSMGFALSMDHVETLALDFVKLKALGFRHLKVRADILMDGMDDAGAPVAAEDFKKLLDAPWPQSDRRDGWKTRRPWCSCSITLWTSPRASCSANPARCARTLRAPVDRRRR